MIQRNHRITEGNETWIVKFMDSLHVEKMVSRAKFVSYLFERDLFSD